MPVFSDGFVGRPALSPGARTGAKFTLRQNVIVMESVNAGKKVLYRKKKKLCFKQS